MTAAAAPSRVSSVQLFQGLHWSMLPVDGDTKSPLCAWQQFTTRRPDSFDLHSWGRRFPRAGIAVITGPISDLLVLDADGPEAVEEVMRRGIPETPMVRTPGNPARGRPEGLHVYFRHPKGLAPFKSSTKLGTSGKLDVRGAGSYVVAPHTRRSDGRAYGWLAHPSFTPLADPPGWFLQMLKKASRVVSRAVEAAKGGSVELQSLPKRLQGLVTQVVARGHRSERDFDAVISMLAHGLSEDSIRDLFERYPVGDKYREAGDRYLKRTIDLAQEAVKVVQIKYADLDGSRLHLGFVVEEGTDAGALLRCGITVSRASGGGVDERWVKFLEAAGMPLLRTVFDSADAKRLIGRRLRLEVNTRRGNPVVGFYGVDDEAH